MIEFYKYQGAGNDFIMIDNISRKFSGNKVKLAKAACDRHFGIGSDGIIFIEKSKKADFKMDFYNPDGSQSFCGNGSRCAVEFANFLNKFNKSWVDFEAIDGVHKALLSGDGNVKVSMQPVIEVKEFGNDLFMNTGSPHYIIEVEDVKESDLIDIGRRIRYNKTFSPGGTNVNLVQSINKNQVAIRTYERGVEDETFACGTGATAVALFYAVKNEISNGVVEVKALGGDLKVYFEKSSQGFNQIFLEGPARYVFKGVINE